MSDSTPGTQAFIPPRQTQPGERALVEADIKDDAEERFYPEYYEMKTSDKIDGQARELAADPEASQLFEQINAIAQAPEHNESAIARSVCLLATLVRTRMGNNVKEPGYGIFVFQGDQQSHNVSRESANRSLYPEPR